MVDATSSNAYAQQLKERELDPNVLQRIAADPDVNVWVNASAGTGKTKVLTDRVLRLLLPRHDGRMGAHPAKILCITFTKAGASEMILRVQDTLARWTSIEDGDEETKGSLRFELRQLFGRKPTKMQVSSAKSLFRQIIDMPNGMNIMTIHSFCQSILARFPLEASISPNMNMIDEAQSKILLDEARLSVMRQSYKERSSDLARCVYNLARTVNSDQFMDLLVGMLKERDQLFSILERYPSFEHIHYDLCGLYKIDPQLDEQSSIRQSVSEYAIDREGLKNAALKMLGSKSKKDNERGAIIESFLSAVSEEERAEQFYRYLRAFLSTKYEPYANIATKTLCKVHEEIFDVLANECDRLIVVLNDLKAIKNARHSVDLMQCGHAFIQAYMQLKHERAMLDFDDQILKTLDLLRTSAAWVLYKLDQGIEHILLDEAQDTNPEQWQIVEALYQEFYTQEVNAGDNPRTVFVVGDEKQSIYGFQRASPEKFSEMRSKLKGLVHTMGQAYEDVGLNISFRTTPPVLKAVDLTFGPDFMRKGVSHDPVEHTSFRRGQAGLVEMWPLCEPQDNEDLDLWSGFKKPLDEQEGDAMLAQQIADKIAYWIDHKEILETHARPIQAGDIMILVRSRTRFVHQLIRALKSKMIPVSGADRLIVTDHIGVHDLMALMQFSLLPEDDLNLASLLKSPLLGMSEDDLFDLSYGRTTSLWQVLRTSERYAHYASYLMRVMQWMKSNRPYEFFNKVFTSPCPSSDRSGMCAFKNRLGDDVHDIFYEFLSLAMRYEETYVPDFQGFIEWLKQNPAEIKRELESDGNEVRIMTVHGSKGLQAPIVILPETIRNGWSNSSKGSDRFLWPRQTDLSLPIWCPRSGDEDALYAQQSQAIKIRDIHEDKRLLYVAMTRAEERLYVCGYLKKKKPVDESWYVYIKNALENCDQTENDDDILRLRHVTTADPDRVKEKQDKYDEGDISVPDWLYAPIKKEQSLQYPFNPSQLVDEMGETIEDAFYTNVRPIYLSRDKAILRGNIIHKLLELLPAASLDKRQTMADNYCSRYTGDLEKDVLLDLQREVFDLLNHPDYGLFFHDNALAEVPVIAKFEDGTSLSGVIDRLYVDEKTVWILDYKTSQTIPDDDCAVPEAYILQLQAYERAIKKIYPDHDIKKALLWSRAPKLMIL